MGVLDRFRQIAPKVLVAVDGQVWGGVAHDRRPVLREVLARLPSVQHLVLLNMAANCLILHTQRRGVAPIKVKEAAAAVSGSGAQR